MRRSGIIVAAMALAGIASAPGRGTDGLSGLRK